MRAVGPPGPSTAASSQLQRKCRVAHVTRRPTSDRLARSGDAYGRVPPGCGERHVRTVWVGTGEPRLAGLDGKDCRESRWVKLDGGNRESDGVVVPLIAGMNPVGGQGPDFGHLVNGAKRERMVGTARPARPGGKHLPPAKVRRLRNLLRAAAKQSSGRRFHASCDRIKRTLFCGRRGGGFGQAVVLSGSMV